ncbi:hypothetical protein RchiOBHm_Chr3g0469021 [Rosa chinensis]|uniref:Transmembrane protein n=1 Tax=Rosa chinensis TaxID=74649 RepID=A0A2P6RAN8_ROSCH|nr:hypothetical protein RchiOBHm_Chr3g0469021 [Rosa chinensis]
MAKSVCSTTVVLVVAFLLIASFATTMVEGKSKSCKKASESFTTPCNNHPECDKKMQRSGESTVRWSLPKRRGSEKVFLLYVLKFWLNLHI